MSRTRPSDYGGATARITRADAAKLGPRWVCQPKIDGAWVRIHLDGQGRIERLFTRSGLELAASGRRSETAAEARRRIRAARAAACGKPLTPYHERRTEPRRVVEPGIADGLIGALVGAPGSVLVGEIEAFTEAGNRIAAANGHRRIHLFDVIRAGEEYVARQPYHVRRDALWRMQSEVECNGGEQVTGRARDAEGCFVSPKVPGWRLTPIVPQWPASLVEVAWGDVVIDGEGEGLVLVNLDAGMGAKSSKIKCRPWETLDCPVVGVSRTTITATWCGHPFNVARGKHEPAVGDVVEVKHAGFYETGVTPKYPSLVRVRRELVM